MAYLPEPFNLDQPLGFFPSRPPHWFPYICAENGRGGAASDVASLLRLHYAGPSDVSSLRSSRDLGRLGRNHLRMAVHRARGARPLMKDPIAVFSSEWLCDTFGMDVVISIRHPAGFAGSLMRLGWTHPFDHFLRQPLLMRDHLAPFDDEVRWFARHERPIVEQAALLWKLIYSTVATFRERRPDWCFVRLEDLAEDPVTGFARIAHHTGLAFNPDIRRAVVESSSASNPVSTSGSSVIHRNSPAAVQAWRGSLSAQDLRSIRRITGEVALEFYEDLFEAF